MTLGSVRKRVWQGMAAGIGLSMAVASSEAAQSPYSINRDITRDLSKPTPISISGFTPEIRKVLAFDLEVAGCRIVATTEAHFRISGRYAARLEGHLQQGDRYVFSKAYTGAVARTLAHAFADEVALAINEVPGVARTRVAFKSKSRGAGEIYVADYDGHNVNQLTRDGAIVAAPAWGLRNTRLYYTSYLRGNPDIYLQEYATGKRRTVVRLPGSNLTPAPSPDGSRLAMVLSFAGSPHLYVSDAEGRNRRQLTFTKAGVSSPCWSPDGRTICYVSREAGPARLFRVSVNGGRSQRIATIGVYSCTEPDWSPDGKTIAFTTMQRGGFTLCTVPAGGGQVTQLVRGEDPSWGPNSRTLMFVKRRANQSYYLSLLDVPTKQVKDVPLNLGNASQPAWAR